MTLGRLLLISALLYAAPLWAQENVEVNIEWAYSNLASSMELYEVKGQPHLWETRSVASIDKAPVAQPLGSGSLHIKPGGKRRFVLVMKNPTGKPIYFFAAPHVAYPPEQSLGFKFKCLCINHAYLIPPGRVWYRVVELRISKGLTTDSLSISHTLTGLDAGQAEPFLLKENPLPDL